MFGSWEYLEYCGVLPRIYKMLGKRETAYEQDAEVVQEW